MQMIGQHYPEEIKHRSCKSDFFRWDFNQSASSVTVPQFQQHHPVSLHHLCVNEDVLAKLSCRPSKGIDTGWFKKHNLSLPRYEHLILPNIDMTAFQCLEELCWKAHSLTYFVQKTHTMEIRFESVEVRVLQSLENLTFELSHSRKN